MGRKIFCTLPQGNAWQRVGKGVSTKDSCGEKSQALAVMEAMKMEHTIAAPADGVVQELLYAAGDQIAEGAELVRLVAA